MSDDAPLPPDAPDAPVAPVAPAGARRARMKTWLLGGAIAVTAVLGVIGFWPSSGSHAGYPFARRLAGSEASPLWQMPPETLER